MGTAAGKAFLDMLGVFAEFESNLRKERQAEGIAAALDLTLALIEKDQGVSALRANLRCRWAAELFVRLGRRPS